MAAMASRTMSGSRPAVFTPGLIARWTKRSPLPSVVRSSWVQSSPALAAKPSSALVGSPLASSAMLRYGPSTSDFCSGCSTATPGSSTARRRGVYSGLASPRWKSMPRFSSAPSTPSKKACASPGSALTGSSSVPSSISRDFCSLMLCNLVSCLSRFEAVGRARGLPPSALRAPSPAGGGRTCVMESGFSVRESPVSRVARGRPRRPPGPACARAGCSAGVRSPRSRGGRPAG